MMVCWFAPAAAQSTQRQAIDYEYRLGKVQKTTILRIESYANTVVVDYLNEFSDREITVLNTAGQPLKCRYFNPDGEQTASTNYDYKTGMVSCQGAINARYPMDGAVYDNNGALFYLMEKKYPPAGGEYNFRLVQSNLYRIKDPFLRFLISQLVGPVPMTLKHVRRETIEWNGRPVETDCFELGVNDPALQVFWAYKYYFWFSTQERLMIKHQGVEPKDLQTYTIVMKSRNKAGDANP